MPSLNLPFSLQGRRWFYEFLYQSKLADKMWDRDCADEALAAWLDKPTDGARALDIGCGTGYNSEYLATMGYRVDAIDFSDRAIRKARARFGDRSNISWHLGDILRYTSAKPYDVIVDYGCFHNLDIETRPRYIDKIVELCAEGGTYVLMALAPRFTTLDWRILGPYHLTPSTITHLFGASFEQRDSADVEHYWNHAPVVLRPLSGPYRGVAYRMRRRSER